MVTNKGMKTYFISDLHLEHANCIRFDIRRMGLFLKITEII